MRCERLTAAHDAADTAAGLRDLIPAHESVREMVAEIIAEVRSHGDLALRDYTRRFDTAGAEPKPTAVTPDELDAATAALAPDVRHGIERAIENLEAVMVGSRPAEIAPVDLGSPLPLPAPYPTLDTTPFLDN